MKKNIFKRRRVVMATMGSHGDLHPYIALALEMKKRYVDPVIATGNVYLTRRLVNFCRARQRWSIRAVSVRPGRACAPAFR